MRNFLFVLLIVGFAAMFVTGCDRAVRKPMMESMTMTEMPTADDPEAYAVALVQAAVDYHIAHGDEATAAHYNDPASIDGQWYVFITDENDIYVAHPAAPSFIGRDIKMIPSIDGTPVGANIAMATSEGRWTEYLWPNPETNKLEQKRTWSIRHDGYLFASGYYESWAPDPTMLMFASKDDPAAYTRDLVLQAIARYEFEGVEATAAYYNDPANIDGEWYLIIGDENDFFVVHPLSPEAIGTDGRAVMSLDGKRMLGAEIAAATGIGLWVEYLWPNPATGEIEQKRTWAIRHDGYIFLTGYYVPATAEALETVAKTAAESTIPEAEAADTEPEAN